MKWEETHPTLPCLALGQAWMNQKESKWDWKWKIISYPLQLGPHFHQNQILTLTPDSCGIKPAKRVLFLQQKFWKSRPPRRCATNNFFSQWKRMCPWSVSWSNGWFWTQNPPQSAWTQSGELSLRKKLENKVPGISLILNKINRNSSINSIRSWIKTCHKRLK